MISSTAIYPLGASLVLVPFRDHWWVRVRSAYGIRATANAKCVRSEQAFMIPVTLDIAQSLYLPGRRRNNNACEQDSGSSRAKKTQQTTVRFSKISVRVADSLCVVHGSPLLHCISCGRIWIVKAIPST